MENVRDSALQTKRSFPPQTGVTHIVLDYSREHHARRKETSLIDFGPSSNDVTLRTPKC